MRLTWHIRHGKGYSMLRQNRKPYGKDAEGYKAGRSPGSIPPWGPGSCGLYVTGTMTFDDFMKLYQAGGQTDEIK